MKWGHLLQSVLEMTRMGPGRGQKRWKIMRGSKTRFVDANKGLAEGLDKRTEAERNEGECYKFCLSN